MCPQVLSNKKNLLYLFSSIPPEDQWVKTTGRLPSTKWVCSSPVEHLWSVRILCLKLSWVDEMQIAICRCCQCSLSKAVRKAFLLFQETTTAGIWLSSADRKKCFLHADSDCSRHYPSAEELYKEKTYLSRLNFQLDSWHNICNILSSFQLSI